MKYTKLIYVTTGKDGNKSYLLAFHSRDEAVDSAECEGSDVAVYQLVKRYKPKVTRSLV